MKRIKTKFSVEIEVPFEPYKTAKLNRKAINHIKRWITEALQQDLSFIPLYIEKDEHGSSIEDCSCRTKFTVKTCQ